MTPSQEAKEYATKHGFGLALHKSKRVRVEHGNKYEEFSGYPAALNYMRRIVSERGVEEVSADTLMVTADHAVLHMPNGEEVPVTRGALVAVDIETIADTSGIEELRKGYGPLSVAVDKRVLEAFAKTESAVDSLAQAVGTFQFPCAVGAKRWRKIKRAQRKADRLRMCRICRYDQVTSRRAWRVFADHQLQASCDSRKEAIAYVRSELAGQRDVTVQYV